MRIEKPLLACAALSALSFTAQAQLAPTYQTLVEESFDYSIDLGLDGADGGTGWSVPWWSGGNSQFSNAKATSPGYDGIGIKATTNINQGGSYRRVDFTGYDHMTELGPWEPPVPPDWATGPADGPLFGTDGTTLWISFDMQKEPGSDADWAGLSLFIWLDPNGVGEYLFIGKPYLYNDWGIAWAGGTNAFPVDPSVALTDFDKVTHLVAKVSFMPGQEQVQLWIDPPVDYPDPAVITPALDQMVTDFRFNEVRIASGHDSTPFPTSPYWNFDSIKIECEDCEPPQTGPMIGEPTFISLSSGGTQTLSLDAGPDYAGLTYWVLGSANGTSPALPVDNIQIPLFVDNYFLQTITAPNLPPLGNSLGVLDLNGQATATFTLPPDTNPAYVGLQANHAFVTIDFNGVAPFLSYASTPASCDLIP